jgi:hypothetical protein
MAHHFACNCGAVHSDCCDNCGRFTSLARDEHIEMCESDAPCDKGQVEHIHTDEERSKRIDAFFARARGDA